MAWAAGKLEELRASDLRVQVLLSHMESIAIRNPTRCEKIVAKAIDFVRRSGGIFGGEGGKMRLVKLLPRWLTPRVEIEPYDPPQDDPPQGDVAENEASGFRGPNPPADLQEARRAAKERYQLMQGVEARGRCASALHPQEH